MELTAVFSKTMKGHDEISTRQNRLPFRVRAMLIMIDGRHTGSELVAQSIFGAEAEQHLALLLEGDFIAAPTMRALLTGHPAEDITFAKRYVLRTLRELLGPEAHPFALIIEKAKTAQELLQHLEKLREPLITGVGKKKADQFWEKMSLVLAW
jgi:hypothetical protein